MPLMAYLAVDHLEEMTRGDFVRLAYATAPGDRHVLPFSEDYLADFEANHCFDRYYDVARCRQWTQHPRDVLRSHASSWSGTPRGPSSRDAERGVLGQFRHQFFLLALIAHMHKAALLMMSDRLVQTVTSLDINEPNPSGGFAPGSGACTKSFFASPIATGFTMYRTTFRRASCSAGWSSSSGRIACTPMSGTS